MTQGSKEINQQNTILHYDHDGPSNITTLAMITAIIGVWGVASSYL